MSPDPLLVVDGANVVGSRPDGWWRDRAGAAARLHARLAAARAAGRLGTVRVVLVLEGRARPGVAAGDVAGVEVVHASGLGDDDVVRRAAAAVRDGATPTVVTADRELATRVERVGAAVARPGWLLDRLEDPGASDG